MFERMSGPLGALVCYLKELGVQGEQLDAWVFPKVSSRHTFPGDRGLPLPFEPRNPEDTFGIEKALARAIRAARWGRIAGQDSGASTGRCPGALSRKAIEAPPNFVSTAPRGKEPS